MNIDQEIKKAKRRKDFELVKDLEETKISIQIKHLKETYKNYEKKYFQGANSVFQNAADTVHEQYGKHWQDLTLDQELHFWQMATELDSIIQFNGD